MNMWIQQYDPCGNVWLSTLLASIPIVLLLGLLVGGMSAPKSAIMGLISALLIASFGFGMPISMALSAAMYGACFGLLPIGWIVLSAVFLFKLTVHTGQFDVVKRSVAAISPDRRVQALLIAFSFGAFVEGAAGFGTPVAISAALMLGLGFSPIYAAGLALIANTSPVAFGALGTPILTLGQISGIDPFLLSKLAGRQLPIFSLIVPFWLVATMSGWRGVVGCWPAILVAGASFASIQFLVAQFNGPTLVDVAGGIGSLLAVTVFLYFWKPKTNWRFPDELAQHLPDEETPLDTWTVLRAWMPWIFLTILVFVWGTPAAKTWMNAGIPLGNQRTLVTKFAFKVPSLHAAVYRASPVAVVEEGMNRAKDPEKAELEIPWLATTGTGIFVAAVLSALFLGVGPITFGRVFADTVYQMRFALLTIAAMLALAFVTKYSGCDATLGLAFTRTGWFYPFFAPLLGWLGVALTGSDTSSNALFGSLQRITAEQLGLPVPLIVASNSTGGVMGKMIDAQSIVVAAVATGRDGDEGKILRFVFPHSLALAFLMGLLTFWQAYFGQWTLP